MTIKCTITTTQDSRSITLTIPLTQIPAHQPVYEVRDGRTPEYLSERIEELVGEYANLLERGYSVSKHESQSGELHRTPAQSQKDAA